MSSEPAPLSLEILVIGAGVLGLCTAAELTRRGRDVRVLDPGGLNASAVAAGMIAPAMESAIDDVTPERAALLRRAADLWPGFAEAHGLELLDDGAEWRGEGADEIEARLRALGFAPRRDGDRVFAPEDRRVDAEDTLAALSAGLPHSLILAEAQEISATVAGWRVRHSGGVVDAGMVVLATGAAAALPGLPDDAWARVSGILPIRGQIGLAQAQDEPGVVRGLGAYAASGEARLLIGATMEAGRRDLEPDPVTGQGLIAALERFSSAVVDPAEVDWRVGVRGATADGLPLAGASGAPGLFLALAPRRNGWLLGPMVGRVVADAVEGGTSLPDAAALDPLRSF
ncbi:MAG: NAD(P)/FAD-dependent oxidoreductase [Brevundimonas sp.]|uniref:NAD(P)/FAD-dependent oxidoreductase n=1 Tax=Brevundimonas sp. TaxID=1871086 RepID=UPI0040337218